MFDCCELLLGKAELKYPEVPKKKKKRIVKHHVKKSKGETVNCGIQDGIKCL